MTTFYVGYRPVLRGRSTSEFVNPNKGNSTGTYSNYHLFGPGVLAGGPDNNHTPGTGYHPGDVALSRRARGLDTLSPLDGPGSGVRISGARFSPLAFKGLAGAVALNATGATENEINVALFNGVTSAQALLSPGQDIRGFNPHLRKGVGTEALASAGNTDPEYGHENVNVWAGVTSAKAL